MKSHFGLKLAIPYLVITVGIIIWIMTKSGDTPIFPALFVLLPWGFMFSEHAKDLPELTLSLVNVGFNTVLLYVIGTVFQKLISRNKES